ncbi:MAG: tetratricopeptide repeat protein [Pseudomonadota bacterium]
MNDYASDEEQIEAIRKWWSENGKFIIAGIALGIAGLVGFRVYSNNLAETRAEASGVYSQLVDASESGDAAQTVRLHEKLLSEYATTPYAAQSYLAAAKAEMDRGDTEAAIAALQAMLDSDAPEAMRAIARLRLAKALNYLERGSDARALLSGFDGGNFQPRFDEALGDIEAALGNREEARSAYQAAISGALGTRMIDAELVQLKIAALGLSSQAMAAEESTE